MNLETLLLLCKAYRSLGDAVGDQLCEIVRNPASIGDQNGNALRLAKERFLLVVLRYSEDDDLDREVEEVIQTIDAH